MSFAIGTRMFQGPYVGVDQITDQAGVFVVVCKEPDGGFFLVDVGESDQLRTRLAKHDRKDCWARVCVKRYEVPQFGVLSTSCSAKLPGGDRARDQDQVQASVRRGVIGRRE